HHATQSLDTERQGGNVKQEQVRTITRQHRTLDGSATGNSLDRDDVATWITAKEPFDLFLHFGHAGHPTDQNHIINFGDAYTSICNSSAARLDRTCNQVLDQRLELGTADFQVQVLGTGLISSDIGQVDLCLLGRRKFDLGLFSSFFETL